MISSLKLRKSAGVPVALNVHRLITQANKDRDSRDWPRAAAGYRQALEHDPTLAHIRIQLGHALKETGCLVEAEEAYREVLERHPDHGDAHLHLGHLKKLMGDRAAAGRHYLNAAEYDPRNIDAIQELHAIAGEGTRISPADLVRALRREAEPPVVAPTRPVTEAHSVAPVRPLLEIPPSSEMRDTPLGRAAGPASWRATEDLSQSAPATTLSLVFDISDLVAYFGHSRLPTGIQRVQIETISAILRDEAWAGAVSIYCFVEQRDDWLPVPAATFLNLCRLSLSGGGRDDPEWTSAIDLLQVSMNIAGSAVFPQGAYLINLGTSWWLQNYFLYVRRAKALYGIRYVPFVHDMIPIMTPEHCNKGLTQDFISWAMGVFQHADFFLVNSLATRTDLLEVARTLGHEVGADQIAVIRLDADFRKPLGEPLPRHVLDNWRLEREPFVLFVSTVESRKNHLAAFDAWTTLVRKHGPRRVPKLVCVGKRGWLNDAVYQRLEASDLLRERVMMLADLSDGELELLYRECLFTLYPSHYEGWGLPVTEALCYGKAPLISNSSSLPEAGGPFAEYFAAGSVIDLVAALERLMFDTAHRKACEERIATKFRPRSWRDLASEVAEAVSTWAAQGSPGPAKSTAVPFGLYCPLARNVETTIWPGMRSAEIFRGGLGWWHPDNWGCWTKSRGGELEIALPDNHGPLRFYLRLHGLPERDSRVHGEFGGRRFVMDGIVRPGQFRWVAFDIPESFDDPTLRIFIQGDATQDLAEMTGGRDKRVISIGVQGFFLCDAFDAAARSAFLEAVVLDDFTTITFGRPTGRA